MRRRTGCPHGRREHERTESVARFHASRGFLRMFRPTALCFRAKYRKPTIRNRTLTERPEPAKPNDIRQIKPSCTETEYPRVICKQHVVRLVHTSIQRVTLRVNRGARVPCLRINISKRVLRKVSNTRAPGTFRRFFIRFDVSPVQQRRGTRPPAYNIYLYITFARFLALIRLRSPGGGTTNPPGRMKKRATGTHTLRVGNNPNAINTTTAVGRTYGRRLFFRH